MGKSGDGLGWEGIMRAWEICNGLGTALREGLSRGDCESTYVSDISVTCGSREISEV